MCDSPLVVSLSWKCFLSLPRKEHHIQHSQCTCVKISCNNFILGIHSTPIWACAKIHGWLGWIQFARKIIMAWLGWSLLVLLSASAVAVLLLYCACAALTSTWFLAAFKKSELQTYTQHTHAHRPTIVCFDTCAPRHNCNRPLPP